MFRRKYYLYLEPLEYGILVKSLIQLRNRLIRQGRYADCVDDLIMKVTSAPVKRI